MNMLWHLISSRMAGLASLAGSATTGFATGATETVKRWAARLWIELPREIYFTKFMKEDMNAVIELKNDLEGKPGDKVTFTLLQKLAAAATTGDTVLEGSEEAMTFYSDAVTIDQERNAVRLVGAMSESRTAYDQRDGGRTVLKTWMAETIDNKIFTGFSTSASTIIYGGSATATANVDSTSKFTPSLMDKAVAKGKKASPKIWPVRVGGKDLYVVVIHTDISFDLRRDAEWNQAQRDANIRGFEDNPIFTGMLGYWNGCIVHEHEKIPAPTNWGAGSNVTGAQNFFLGRQAGVFAFGRRPQWWEKEFDYGNSIGFAIGTIYGFKKAVFNAVDHAYEEIRTFRTNN